jgi:hypothetical protein
MAELERYNAPRDLDRVRNVALGIGGIALILWVIGLVASPEQALRSWLLGFIYWGGISIGGLGILMLGYLTGGAWSIVIRRICEAAARTLPLVVILFVPLAVGVMLHTFMEFTHLPPDDHVMHHRGVFMAPWFWVVRSVIYFVLFGFMAYLLTGWGEKQDRTDGLVGAERLMDKASRFSGPMMVIYALIVTFAVVDWVMLLDPHWFSTIWGLLFLVGWALSTFAFSIVLLAYLNDKAPMNAILTPRHFHDLGKLLLALTMVWAYFNFSQYLIIYSGNIPEETTWFITRSHGGWGVIGILLIVFHFAFPFLILLNQEFKKRARWIATLGVFILFMRLLDMFWNIAPTPRITEGIVDGSFYVSWMDIVAPVAIGGIWLWWFLGSYLKRPLVPVNDPFYPSAVTHGRGGH